MYKTADLMKVFDLFVWPFVLSDRANPNSPSFRRLANFALLPANIKRCGFTNSSVLQLLVSSPSTNLLP